MGLCALRGARCAAGAVRARAARVRAVSGTCSREEACVKSEAPHEPHTHQPLHLTPKLHRVNAPRRSCRRPGRTAAPAGPRGPPGHSRRSRLRRSASALRVPPVGKSSVFKSSRANPLLSTGVLPDAWCELGDRSGDRSRGAERQGSDNTFPAGVKTVKTAARWGLGPAVTTPTSRGRLLLQSE